MENQPSLNLGEVHGTVHSVRYAAVCTHVDRPKIETTHIEASPMGWRSSIMLARMQLVRI